MFKIVPNLCFWWPVRVLEPDPENPGKLIEQEFEARLRLMSDSDAKQMAAKRRAILDKFSPDLGEEQLQALNDELETHDKAALAKVLVDWRNIVDGDGKPLPFNEGTFAAVFDMGRARVALNRAYGEAISEDRARLGN